MQIKNFSNYMLPSLAGFFEKNNEYLSSMLPGSSLIVNVTQNQIKGIVKDKVGNKTKLKKAVIKFK